ncbi:MAG: glycosyltransferase [Candidatus Riflebacteria bacterium]|nr:glycosyltransferase [Candidatus Riflebacteria bacterium]
MRILQLINALTLGGAQTLVFDLCRFLARNGHQPVVATFRDGPIGDRLRSEGIEVVKLSESGIDLLGMIQLSGLLRRLRPDVVHSHLFRATFWARVIFLGAGNRGIPLVSSIHGSETAEYHLLERLMATLSARLIFPSHHLAEWYCNNIRRIPAHRGQIIHPGVEISGEPDFAGRANQFPREPLLGTLSRLHPVKGLDILIEALARLNTRGKRFRLVIGGDGRERERLEKLVAQRGLQGRVEFAGSISSPGAFLDALDIFIAPSREEAFGITICEAMERGIPVVGSAVGGIREIVRSGVDGLLVTPDDSDVLANALERLLDNRMEVSVMGRNARERVVRDFPRERALERHLEMYERLIPRPVLQVAVSSGELGGGERLALELSRSLHDRGWNLHLLCGIGRLSSLSKNMGIPVRSASLRASGFFFAIRLLAELRKNRAMVVHAHLNRAALFASRLKKIHGVPVAAHVHGLNRESYYRCCDKVFAVSKAVEEHLTKQGMSKQSLRMLPNALPLQAFPENPALFRCPGPPWVIGIIAKLHRNKGHIWALEALESAVAAGYLPPLDIRIFGDGPERERLESRFKSGVLAEYIRFFGFREDIEKFIPELHVAMLPSLGEGIPLSLLEAARWGVPAISTRVGGVPELIIDGENGILVEPGDGKGLVESLKFMTSPAVWRHFSDAAWRMFPAKNGYVNLIETLDRELLELAEKR